MASAVKNMESASIGEHNSLHNFLQQDRNGEFSRGTIADCSPVNLRINDQEEETFSSLESEGNYGGWSSGESDPLSPSERVTIVVATNGRDYEVSPPPSQWDQGLPAAQRVDVLPQGSNFRFPPEKPPSPAPVPLPLPPPSPFVDLRYPYDPPSLSPPQPSLERSPRCVFCRKCGYRDIYHQFKDEYGHVVCPVLSKYRCRLCGVTGAFAHTQKYCPLNPVTLGDPVAAGLPPGLLPNYLTFRKPPQYEL